MFVTPLTGSPQDIVRIRQVDDHHLIRVVDILATTDTIQRGDTRHFSAGWRNAHL